jgi:hypothetical protein
MTQPAPLNRFRQHLATAARATILVACVGWIVHFFIQNRGSLALLGRMSLLTVTTVTGLSAVYLVLYAYRFLLVLEKCSGKTVPFRPLMSITMQCRFLNLVFAQLGNVYRALQLKQRYQISYTDYVGTFAAFAWLDTALNIAITLVLIVATNPGLRIGPRPAWALVLAAFAGVVLLPILLERGFSLLSSAPGGSIASTVG